MARTWSGATPLLLYIVLVLLPHMLWLHHSNGHGLLVCEACGSLMEAALSNRAKGPSVQATIDELPCGDDAVYQEHSEKDSDYTGMNDTHYTSLCSCSVDRGGNTDTYIDDAPNGGWWVLITLVSIEIPVTIGALLVAILICPVPVQ